MKGITRILHKTFIEFCALSKNYGLRLAFYNLVWWINFYIPTPLRFKMSRWALLRKTKWLDKYISSKYGEIISRYATSHQYDPTIQEPKIWVFWGQGADKMPPLIKACWNQLNINYTSATLLTADNIKQYLEISEIIYQKVEEGRLSWAHFSDIIRNQILHRHGGLWLDATVWTTAEIPFNKLHKLRFYSANGIVHNTPTSNCFWTSFNYNWSTWCMWSNISNYPLFGFVGDMMAAIAQHDNCWPDYVLQDFLIYYAITHFAYLKKDFEYLSSLPCHNRGKLASLMNSPFDEETYRQLCRDDFVFKLSFRSAWKPRTPDGKLTFYGRLFCDQE